MRHQSAGRKLGRTTAHRWALFKNQLASLVDKGRIETTLHKAKELRSFADHLITLGKKNSLHTRRQAFDYLRNRTLVAKLFNEVAPQFNARAGGYTRVLKLGFRLGDSAPMALIEYVEGAHLNPVKKDTKTSSKKKKAAQPKKTKPVKAEASALESASEKAAKPKKAAAPKKAKKETASKATSKKKKVTAE